MGLVAGEESEGRVVGLVLGRKEPLKTRKEKNPTIEEEKGEGVLQAMSNGEGWLCKKTPRWHTVYCPLPECSAPPLKKVSQHLRQFHKLRDADICNIPLPKHGSFYI